MSKAIACWGATEQRRKLHVESFLRIVTLWVISHVLSYAREIKPKLTHAALLITLTQHVKMHCFRDVVKALRLCIKCHVFGPVFL